MHCCPTIVQSICAEHPKSPLNAWQSATEGHMPQASQSRSSLTKRWRKRGLETILRRSKHTSTYVARRIKSLPSQLLFEWIYDVTSLNDVNSSDFKCLDMAEQTVLFRRSGAVQNRFRIKIALPLLSPTSCESAIIVPFQKVSSNPCPAVIQADPPAMAHIAASQVDCSEISGNTRCNPSA